MTPIRVSSRWRRWGQLAEERPPVRRVSRAGDRAPNGAPFDSRRSAGAAWFFWKRLEPVGRRLCRGLLARLADLERWSSGRSRRLRAAGVWMHRPSNRTCSKRRSARGPQALRTEPRRRRSILGRSVFLKLPWVRSPCIGLLDYWARRKATRSATSASVKPMLKRVL